MITRIRTATNEINTIADPAREIYLCPNLLIRNPKIPNIKNPMLNSQNISHHFLLFF